MKKIFTLFAVACMALSASAKEEILISGFNPWDNCTVDGNTISMAAGYKGGAIGIYRDMSEYDYVWIKFSNATGNPNFGITYDEWLSNADWGPVFASTTTTMSGTGIVGIKIDKETVMVHGNAENDGVGIGDVYSQHVQQLTIQGQAGAAEVTVEGIYFGTTAEYVADGGDVPMRPEPGGSMTMWEGDLVFTNNWSETIVIDAKYFDVAEVDDVIYCSVKDVTESYNPIFKIVSNWSDFTDIQNTIIKDDTHFEGTIATPEALNELKKNGLRFQGIGFTLTKVELKVPASTGIEAVTTTTNAEGVRYNLAGQRVDASYKGVVIMNGKKFINK